MAYSICWWQTRHVIVKVQFSYNAFSTIEWAKRKFQDSRSEKDTMPCSDALKIPSIYNEYSCLDIIKSWRKKSRQYVFWLIALLAIFRVNVESSISYQIGLTSSAPWGSRSLISSVHVHLDRSTKVKLFTRRTEYIPHLKEV